jgi:hypothetical protein
MKKNKDIKIIPFDNVGFHGIKFIGKDNKEVSLSFEKNSIRNGLCIFVDQSNITNDAFGEAEVNGFDFSDVVKALKHINAI